MHYMKHYLEERRHSREDAVCVVNVGIHDQKLCPGLKSEDACLEVYTNNVGSHLKLLNTTCGQILWLATTSTMDKPRQPQLNSRAIIWNRRVNEMMASEYPDNGYYIDVWNASQQATHRDNVHFVSSYYQQLGRLFSSLM